ncbi:unnamed protein product [Laminaria digitata]
MVAKFFADEIEGPCNGCKKSRVAKQANKKTRNSKTLTKAPPKLFICFNRVDLKRVKVNGKDRSVPVKITEAVDIPLVLDMGPHMAGGTGNAMYDVDATIHHKGSTSQGGHYAAYARVEGREWCWLSDSRATTVGTGQALGADASILSYTKRP